MPTRARTPVTARDKPQAAAERVNQTLTTSSAAEQYRRLALALPDAIESSHMGAPDFRVDGRIFATLAYEAKGLGTVMLTPEQQAACLQDAPEHFTPAPGKWGQNGTSLVRLDAPENVIAGALSMAHRNVVQKSTKPKSRGSLRGKP